MNNILAEQTAEFVLLENFHCSLAVIEKKTHFYFQADDLVFGTADIISSGRTVLFEDCPELKKEEEEGTLYSMKFNRKWMKWRI